MDDAALVDVGERLEDLGRPPDGLVGACGAFCLKEVGQIAPAWLFSLFKKASRTPIPDPLITKICSKSDTATKQITTYLTGLRFPSC